MIPIGMPVRIYTEAECAVSLGVVCLHLSVYIQQSRSVLASDVNTVFFRIAPVVGVAVHTAVKMGVFDQSLLLVVRKTSFVDSHLAVNFVSWCDETIIDSVIDFIFRYVDGPGLREYAAFYMLSVKRF